MTEGPSNTPKDAQAFISTSGIDVSPVEYVATRDDLRFALRSEVLATGKPSVTIVGSFRFKDKIDEIIGQFEQNGIIVLAPGRGRVTREVDGFPLLEIDDEEADPRAIEEDFLLKAECSDAVYIVDSEGYAGMSSAYEIGFIFATGTPRYSLEPLDETVSEGDRMWGAVCDIVEQKTVEEMIEMLKIDTFDVEDMSYYKPWNPLTRMKRIDWYRLLLPGMTGIITQSLREEARRRVKADPSGIAEELMPFLDLD